MSHPKKLSPTYYQILKSICPESEILSLRDFLKKEFSALQRLYNEKFHVDLNTPKKHDFFEQKLSSDALSTTEKQTLRGQFPLTVRLSDIIIEFGCRLGILLSQKLDKDIAFMHMPPMARFVAPYNKSGMVPPHADIEYNQHMEEFITAWVPLIDIRPTVGGLRFYEYKLGKEEAEKNIDLSTWLPPVEDYEAQPFQDVNDLDTGDVIVFEQNCVHASLPNTSETMRFSLDLRFFTSKIKSSKSFINVHTKELTRV